MEQEIGDEKHEVVKKLGDEKQWTKSFGDFKT